MAKAFRALAKAFRALGETFRTLAEALYIAVEGVLHFMQHVCILAKACSLWRKRPTFRGRRSAFWRRHPALWRKRPRLCKNCFTELKLFSQRQNPRTTQIFTNQICVYSRNSRTKPELGLNSYIEPNISHANITAATIIKLYFSAALNTIINYCLFREAR